MFNVRMPRTRDDAERAAHEAATRLIRSQKLERGSPYLRAEAPPTHQQICAVLNALADHTLLSMLNSEDALVLGQDRGHLGEDFARASAQGQFLQLMGDRVDQAGMSEEQA